MCSSTISSESRSSIARLARTSSGTKAFLDPFERQVDPDGVLPGETRAAMA
jgi:hypothetical protein